MQPLPSWDEMRRGVGCPLCLGRRDVDFHPFVRTLGLSSLYLTKGQTYRGSCTLIVDARHVNYLNELSQDEWGQVAQDLRDSERAVLVHLLPITSTLNV
jgi:diadenosine tetraphosphate (Ap4A) HIT family hydrolase